MSALTSRITQGVTFDHGIRAEEHGGEASGLTPSPSPSPFLSGETTVADALGHVFQGATVCDLIAEALAQEGSLPTLRTGRGFRSLAMRTARSLRGAKGRAAQAAADEIEALLGHADELEERRTAAGD